MTEEAFVKRVKYWQKILKLDHWRIGVDFEIPADAGTSMQIVRSKAYDDATINTNVEWVDWSDDRIDQLIVHELLHLVHRDVDYVFFDMLQDQLSPNVYSLVEKQYEYASEKVVDRLSHIITSQEVLKQEKKKSASNAKATKARGSRRHPRRTNDPGEGSATE